MTHKEIILKLIGDVHPQGEHCKDEEAFVNLKNLCLLADDLLDVIKDVSENCYRKESSIARAGGYALKYLSETGTWLHEVTE